MHTINHHKITENHINTYYIKCFSCLCGWRLGLLKFLFFSLFTEFSICLLRLKDSSTCESTLEPKHVVEDHTEVEGT